MSRVEFIKKTRDKLNAVSPSLCAMKWLHETLYLHTGDNHSCYHPRPQHIPLHEIEANPAALHNTQWKKERRKEMLTGVRPEECYYCWNVENLGPDYISDRMIHSASDFAEPLIEKIAQTPWDADVNPRYLELSFGNACNFKCGYCCPQASTSWMDEIKKHGNYDLTYNQYGIEFLHRQLPDGHGKSYYSPREENPYVDAFWKWWPSLRNDLHTLRLTGGEPLMNPPTYRFLDILDQEPAPGLNLSMNSNMGISFEKFDTAIDKIRKLLDEKKINSFTLFTSIDSWGPKAEYMRGGLDCAHWERNLRYYLHMFPQATINFMCTFNVLCVTNFQMLFEKIIEWRKEFGAGRISFDTPYLKEPPHWMINILPESFHTYMDDNMKFLQDNPQWFNDVEIEKWKRVTDYMKTPLNTAAHPQLTDDLIKRGRRDFWVFFNEYDERRGLNFDETFPEYVEFKNFCKTVYDEYENEQHHGKK